MPTMQDSVVVLTNTKSVNVLAGQLFEFADPGALVTVSCTGSLTGLRVNFICGVPLINDQAINLQNRFPLIPDDIIHSGQVPGGRMVLEFINRTVGSITAFWRLDL